MVVSGGKNKRNDISNETRVSRIVILCLVACCVALSVMGTFGDSYDISVPGRSAVSACFYILLWFPVVLFGIFLNKLCDKPIGRWLLFGMYLIFYSFVLITDLNPLSILLIIPFMILTIVYERQVFSLVMSIAAVVIGGIDCICGRLFNNPLTYEKISMWQLVVATAFLLNIVAYIIDRQESRRKAQIERERKKLELLVAVGIKRIFEYDVKNDTMKIATSVNDEYGDERYIEEFETTAKQRRYVLYADYEKLSRFVEDANNGAATIAHEMRLRDHNGDYKWYRVKGATLYDASGAPDKVIGILTNIDEVKRIELRKADEDMRDPLTKLYRKNYAKQLIGDFLKAQNESDRIEFAGFLSLDIDNFDIINDRMGKAFGDEILKNIAADLETLFYPTDILARVGGDDFIIMMKNITSIGDINKKIKEIQKIINRTYVGENVNFGSTVGIGASIYPNDGDDFDTLYNKAEKALFHAKNAGKNCYAFYDPALEDVYSTYPIEEKHDQIYTYESESKVESRNTSDSLIELAFKLIDESKDTDSAINLLIRQIQRQMNLGAIAIRKRVGKELILATPYQCCINDDMVPFKEQYEMNLNQWGDMLEDFRIGKGMMAYSDVSDVENQTIRQFMLAQGAKSFVSCAFYDKGEFVGSMEFIDYDITREWTQDELMTVRAVSNVVSSYLLKMKAYEDASDTVERLTGYDGVTGLVMYEKFITLPGEFIESAPHGNYAVVYMDFSNFKYVNETYGYEIGDRVLRELAAEAASYKDYYIYGSRVFSDNLVVLCRMGNRSVEEMIQIFERASKRFTDRIEQDYIDSRLIIDIGVCPFEICGRPVPFKNIISNANLARKRTKLPDNPRCIVYDDSMGDELKAEVAYASDMENAFQNHEFVVYMQPKVNLETNKIDGAEALIRWKKQDGTLIFPNDFIPVFEKNKSITLLDYFVYDEVCKYLRDRLDRGKKIVRISMNVSRVHLYSIDSMVAYVSKLIEKYSIPPAYLEFELTETVFTDKVNDTIALMTKLRKLGVMVSMDDFGSGYSSLNVLTKLPIDVLKLDKDFLDDFDNDSDEKVIIPSVIDMAKKLNLSVVCEGVETNEQVTFLRDVGCDYAQGYFYSKPIPQQQFDELLEIS